MQLDRTLIAVRERNVLDILDLALHVLRHYGRPIAITFLLGAFPLAVINVLLIGWIPDFEYTEESLIRYSWLMLVLIYFEAPLAGAVTTTYLGKAVFMQQPRIRDCLRDVAHSALALGWTLLLLRGVLPLWLLLLMLDRYGEFNSGVEVGLVFLLLIVVAAVRAFRPYITEVILLEKNPLFARGSQVMTVGGRSSRFHSPNSGEVFSRWLACSAIGLLLCYSLVWTMLWFPGVFTNNWSFGPYMLYVGMPVALWLVVCYFTVVRFLNYLDLRIRQEGWEVELRVRAEAARMKLHMGEQSSRPSLVERAKIIAPLLFLAVSLLLGMASLAHGQSEQIDPVESAREALASRSDVPWYDRQTDSLRRVEVQPRNPNPNPSNPNWKQQQTAPPNWNFSWLEWFWYFLQWLFWALIVGLICLVIWLLVRAFLVNEAGMLSGSHSAADDEHDQRADADRIEQLPFRVGPKNRGDLLAEARRAYEQGNYRQAIIYLYSFQLLLLDRHHLIRLTKGKTNRQYLREARMYRRVAELLEGVMLPFEDVFFGDHPLDRQRFETCWNALPEFQQLVEQEGPAQ